MSPRAKGQAPQAIGGSSVGVAVGLGVEQGLVQIGRQAAIDWGKSIGCSPKWTHSRLDA